MRGIGTDGLDYGSTCHLQIDHPWHDALPLDHMVSQEKLVAAKSRTEPLFPQRGGVVLHQRMQRGVVACVPCARDGCRCVAGCLLSGGYWNPVAFASERICWQTDPAWQGRGKPCPYGIEVFPIDCEALDPQREQFPVLPFAHPGRDCFL